MPNFDFAIPTRTKAVPVGDSYFHEVKHDGFRVRLERDGDRVRLFSRNGYDFSRRYPWIVESARKIRSRQFVLDGEAVVLGVDRISSFDDLVSGKHNDEV